MLRFLRLALLVGTLGEGLAPQGVRAADVPIFPTGPVFKIQPPLTWGTSTQPGFNNNFFFTPLNINESVCVFVYNNNTTNAHTFTAAIQVTGDPASTGPSTGTWQTAANSSLTAAIGQGLPAGIGASVTGASQVSVNFSASSTLGGSPETATVTIIQTQGNCFAGNQFVGSAPQSVASIEPIQVISEGLSQGFGAAVEFVNTSAGQNVLHVNANSGAKSVFGSKIVISSTAAGTFAVQATTTTGTTCTAATIQNLKPASSVTSTALVNFSCTINPTAVPVFRVAVGANVPFVFDLSGLIGVNGSTTGFEITSLGAITGTIEVGAFWYEK